MPGRDLSRQMAAAIWEDAGGRGAVPAAALEAADDLVEMYERLNNAPLEAMVARVPGVTGEDLAWFALAPGVPATDAMYVPLFKATLEGGDLVWEGGERPYRNPGPRANPCACHPNPSGDLEVLLIEDEPKNQVNTTKMIKRLFPTAHVLVADNGEAAIANLKHHSVKLVVSDIDILGSMSGVDVFRWVQDNQPHLVDKYVFFSGNTTENVEQLHYRVLMKPAGAKELREVIWAPAPGSEEEASAKTRADRRAGRPSVPPPAPLRRPGESARVRHEARLPPRPMQSPLDATTVAQIVNDALPLIKETPGGRAPEGYAAPLGRFGPDKVYISAIWRQVQRDLRLTGMTLPEFKKQLIIANREGRLALARADLVGAMDANEVAESEIESLGATFHFVLDRQAQARRGW